MRDLTNISVDCDRRVARVRHAGGTESVYPLLWDRRGGLAMLFSPEAPKLNLELERLTARAVLEAAVPPALPRPPPELTPEERLRAAQRDFDSRPSLGTAVVLLARALVNGRAVVP